MYNFPISSIIFSKYQAYLIIDNSQLFFKLQMKI